MRQFISIMLWIMALALLATGVCLLFRHASEYTAARKAEREKAQADEAARTLDVPRPVPQAGAESAQRFTATSAGQFFAGYDNHKREILIIKDTLTGHEYIGITGVGITELWTETYKDGKQTKTRTVEE